MKCSRRLAAALLILSGGMLSGCARTPLVSEQLPADFDRADRLLAGIPFFPQEDYQCGPAALASLLNASGVEVAPAELSPKLYLPARSGSLQVELVAATRRLGRVPYVIDANLSSLLAEVVIGRPVLVLQNLGWRRYPVWHYAVVVGFDAAADTVILHSGRTKALRMTARKFARTWRRGGQWGMVVLRPGEFPANADPGRYMQAVAAMEDQADVAMVETLFAEALRQWPDNALAKLGLANSYLAQGRELQAERLYRQLLTANPENIPARNNLAQSLMQRGCVAAARAELQHARALDHQAGGRYAPLLADTVREFGVVQARRPGRDCQGRATL